MPTDGADFKRRVKYHGRTYTEIKTGADLDTVVQFSSAGLAREILGDNQIPAFKESILATVDCLLGLFSRSRTDHNPWNTSSKKSIQEFSARN